MVLFYVCSLYSHINKYITLYLFRVQKVVAKFVSSFFEMQRKYIFFSFLYKDKHFVSFYFTSPTGKEITDVNKAVSKYPLYIL